MVGVLIHAVLEDQACASKKLCEVFRRKGLLGVRGFMSSGPWQKERWSHVAAT